MNAGKKNSHHEFKLRVYYEDTDAGGIVYHSRYLNFAERARTEFLRIKNIEHNKVFRDFGIKFIVKDILVNYLDVCELDDLLIIQTKICLFNKAKFDLEHIFYKKKKLVCKIKVLLCYLNQNAKVARMPNALYDKIKKNNAYE
tara:strand:- start:115 stop:543 length:429 start_codon:yes stop_codon:yes gene_type:complete